ncbi:MAG: tyrosine-type recombinase/integrase [Candidatus Bathyarchaeales archaeon]
MIRHGVDLADPDAVVTWINSVGWADGTKQLAMQVYRDYMAMKGISVSLPKIRRMDKLPYIPSASEVDAIISSCRLRTGVFLRLLKDTGARALEIWRLRWADVDAENSCVTITPAKGSHARRLKISKETLALLLALPKRNSYVFSPSADPARFDIELEHFARNYCKLRRCIAQRLHNPRLNLISLKTFRHWKATMEYVRTKDILHVKELLGHVNIQNTMKYVHIAKSIIKDQEYDVVFTQDKAELAAKLAEGYEYVAHTEFGHCLRKPKNTL